MNDHKIFAPPIGSGESSSLLPVDARGMSLIHHQECIMPVRNSDEFF